MIDSRVCRRTSNRDSTIISTSSCTDVSWRESRKKRGNEGKEWWDSQRGKAESKNGKRECRKGEVNGELRHVFFEFHSVSRLWVFTNITYIGKRHISSHKCYLILERFLVMTQRWLTFLISQKKIEAYASNDSVSHLTDTPHGTVCFMCIYCIIACVYVFVCYQWAGLDNREYRAEYSRADEQLFLLPQMEMDVMQDHRKKDPSRLWGRDIYLHVAFSWHTHYSFI